MAITIESDVSLKGLNTLAIDVRSRYFVVVDSLPTLQNALSFARENRLPSLILGAGSNIVLTADFPGITLQMALMGIDIFSEDDEHLVLKIGAGENWDELVKDCVVRSLYGLENLSRIPGSVGAAPMQNIGAYGVELSDRLQWVEVWDIEASQVRRLSVGQCELTYRDSIFKHGLKGKVVIIAIALKLSKTPKINIKYQALQQYFAEKSAPPDVKNISAKQVRDAVTVIRLSKLPDPQSLPNVGSFFRNPIVSTRRYAELKARYEELPSYLVDENQVKLPAAWLIERAGWKGYRSDHVGVHDKQALVLVNYDNGSATELLALAKEIQDSVLGNFSIELEIEPQII